jgi:hypothetical protein
LAGSQIFRVRFPDAPPMKINKLDVMLCLAFQGGEGPFDVKVSYSDRIEWSKYTKQQIEDLSDLDAIVSIEICLPRSERRWRDRGGFDPRK